MNQEKFVPNPADPENSPKITQGSAAEIGSLMVKAAGDSVRAANEAREANKLEQLSRPLAPGAITEVPK